ncbi:sugar transferase [candidate division KSB1 bacterium]|nr:MAG: sugar transferase [candidate division KSB1 bacterium]
MKHRWYLRLLLFVCDVVLLETAFFGVYWWRFHTGMFTNPVSFTQSELLGPSLVVTGYWILLFAWFGLYRFDPLQSRAAALKSSLKAAAFGILILFILTFNPDQPLPSSRIILASYGLAIFIIVAGNRLGLLTILRELRIRGIGTLNTLLVGGGHRAQTLLRYISQHPELGMRVGESLVELPDLPILPALPKRAGTLSRLRNILQSRKIDAVLLVPDDPHGNRTGRLLRILRAFRVRTFVTADQYPRLIGEVRPSRVYGHPLVEIRAELLSGTEQFLKRLTDLVFAVFLLLLTLPVWLILIIFVPLSSPGPIFYSQKRVGLNGKSFTLYKFRSMRRDAEAQTGAVLAVAGDPRITPLGRILRALRLDELPQLINILFGQMSLVGPRPERIEFVERFIREIPLYERRLKVKPGLTGWSQVHLKYDRNADQIPVKLKYDFYYIENMSLPLDVKILFMTLFVILRGEGL